MAGVLERRDSTMETMEKLSEEDVFKIRDFVDDDLLSCFMWAASENAMAEPSWKSPMIAPAAPLTAMDDLPSFSLPPTPTSTSSTTQETQMVISKPKANTPKATAAVSNSCSVPSPPSSAVVGPPPCAPGPSNTLALPGPPKGEPLDAHQKHLSRNLRKAESARIARLRKKEYVSGLERQLKDLQTEANALRAQAGGGGQPGGQEDAQKQLGRMGALLRRPSIDNLTPEVNKTVEIFVQGKRKRQDAVNGHLDAVMELISPHDGVGLAFNASNASKVQKQQQGTPAETSASSNGSSTSNGGTLHLLELLSKEIGLTASQQEALKAKRYQMQAGSQLLRAAQQLCEELRSRVAEHIEGSQGVMDKLRKTLTPVQVAKFLLWVEENRKTMDKMNNMNLELQMDEFGDDFFADSAMAFIDDDDDEDGDGNPE